MSIKRCALKYVKVDKEKLQQASDMLQEAKAPSVLYHLDDEEQMMKAAMHLKDQAIEKAHDILWTMLRGL